jgi:hypothetical protein
VSDTYLKVRVVELIKELGAGAAGVASALIEAGQEGYSDRLEELFGPSAPVLVAASLGVFEPSPDPSAL